MASRRKTRRSSGRRGSKASFVLSQGNAPAKDIVAAAKKQGIALTVKYVYTARANAKRQGVAANGAKPASAAVASGSAEGALRRAIAELGLARSRQVFKEVEAAFHGT